MLKNARLVFLAVVMTVAMLISPLGIDYASARTISSQDLNDQEVVVRNAARETLEQYTRLLLYIIIFRLEAQLEAQ